MIRLARAEVQKLTTVWSSYALLAVTAVASGLLGVAVALAPHRRAAAAGLLLPVHGTAAWYDEVFSASVIALDLALVLGVLVVTGEYRHKTVTPTYLAEPRRGRITAAKLVVAAGTGAIVGVVAGVAVLGLGAGLAGVGNGTFHGMFVELGHVVPGVIAGSILFAVYGAGLGALLRNQVVALVVGLGVTAVVEPVIVAVWPGEARWLPSQAARSLESVTSTATANVGLGRGAVHLLPSWEAAVLLLAYGVVLAVTGTFTALRADVS